MCIAQMHEHVNGQSCTAKHARPKRTAKSNPNADPNCNPNM